MEARLGVLLSEWLKGIYDTCWLHGRSGKSTSPESLTSETRRTVRKKKSPDSWMDPHYSSTFRRFNCDVSLFLKRDDFTSDIKLLCVIWNHLMQVMSRLLGWTVPRFWPAWRTVLHDFRFLHMSNLLLHLTNGGWDPAASCPPQLSIPGGISAGPGVWKVPLLHIVQVNNRSHFNLLSVFKCAEKIEASWDWSSPTNMRRVTHRRVRCWGRLCVLIVFWTGGVTWDVWTVLGCPRSVSSSFQIKRKPEAVVVFPFSLAAWIHRHALRVLRVHHGVVVCAALPTRRVLFTVWKSSLLVPLHATHAVAVLGLCRTRRVESGGEVVLLRADWSSPPAHPVPPVGLFHRHRSSFFRWTRIKQQTTIIPVPHFLQDDRTLMENSFHKHWQQQCWVSLLPDRRETSPVVCPSAHTWWMLPPRLWREGRRALSKVSPQEPLQQKTRFRVTQVLLSKRRHWFQKLILSVH